MYHVHADAKPCSPRYQETLSLPELFYATNRGAKQSGLLSMLTQRPGISWSRMRDMSMLLTYGFSQLLNPVLSLCQVYLLLFVH